MSTAVRLVSPIDETAFALGQAPPWCDETERAILGAAMLGEPMPNWLTPEHFFPSQHSRIYEAVQSVGGNVARVNVWLREAASRWKPPIASAVDLAGMCVEADWAFRMGWALDFEKLRDLAKQRALLECMSRQSILLRHGQVDHAGAIAALREHVKMVKA